jgi:hypothetical protein
MAIVDVKLVSGFSVNEKALQQVSLEMSLIQNGRASLHNPLFLMMYTIAHPSNWNYDMCHYI